VAQRRWRAALHDPHRPGLAGAAADPRGTSARRSDPGWPRRPDGGQPGHGPGRATSSVRLRLRDGQGRWVALHGERVTAEGGQAHGISVAIGSARGTVILPLLAAAYGLTGREREVIRCVLTGQSTRQISTRLHITPYTVQDHLKAIFAKLGVTSRGELAHHLAFQFS